MYNDEIMSALADLIKNECSEESKYYKNLILKRIAEETEVKPTRIPAPLNITELGGYYNLIDEIKIDLPDESDFDDPIVYQKFKEKIIEKQIELEVQKYQLKLGIIQSALGLPK